MTIYLAGPMTGLPDWNYPAFNAAAAELRALGLVVVNPAENFNGATDLPYGEYIRGNVRKLIECDEVVLLPGWADSRGAKLEMSIACAIGIPINGLAWRLRDARAALEPES